ncbi:MAG: thioredoxin [Clostridiales bacterium]|nr:thioredoxin [Clostridiales bacterium]
MPIIHLTSEEFKEKINSEKPMLVDFWAPWCGPCRMLAPVLEEVNTTLNDEVVIGKVNVDEEPAIAASYGVLSIPTMIVFEKGEVVTKLVGLRPASDITPLLVK